MKKTLLILLIIGLFAALAAQTVTVTAPNGGEILTRGSQKIITWTKDGFTENVKIDLYKNGVLERNIVASTAGTDYNWTVPNNIYGSDYKVKVTSVTAAFLNDYSDNNFSIAAGSINILAPNGGENVIREQNYNITWSDDFAENVKIELYQGGVLNSTIIASTPSNGSYLWTVPNTISGTDFTIKISSTVLAEINDASDLNFTIAAGNVTVSAPNSGSFNRGSDLYIIWNDDFSENVKIELLKNNVVHTVIAASVLSSLGSFVWPIPLNLSGTDYKIKISSVNFATVSDVSDNDFTIAAGAISTISPTASDIWNLTSGREIKWSNTTTNDPVKIQLFKAGSAYSTIAENGGISGSYYWTLPTNLPKASDYQIKISSIALNTVLGSTANFSINGTVVNGGFVGGIWQLDGSPYIITAKATVPVGNTLEIQAGTKVVVMDTLKVKGNLLANGLQSQSMIESYAPVTVMSGSIQLQNCLFSNNKSWDKTFTGGSAKSIVKTADGGYAVAGSTSTASNSDVWVIKLDGSGNQSWAKTFNGTANSNDGAYSIVQTTDGGYALAGYTNYSDVWVLKLDDSGNQTWAKTFAGTANKDDQAHSIVQTTDGGYVVAGYTNYDGSISINSDVWVIKLNASGTKIWAKTFNGTANKHDGANSIVQTTDGGYVVAGYTMNSNDSEDVWVLKLDGSGNQSWVKTFNGTANSNDYGYSIVQTSDGGYAVAGYTTNSNGYYDVWVLKLDASGNQSWAKSFNGTANSHDYGYSIVQTTDGGYAVAGDTGNNSGNSDDWILKLDGSGNQSWAKIFNGMANSYDYAYSIVQTTDGGYALAGYTYNGSTQDAWVLKIDANGNLYGNKVILKNANANSYLTNCLFNNSNKTALRLENSSPAITNCTFSKNNGDQGGAIYATGNSSPKITNSIFWGNTATTGKQIYLDGTNAKPEFKYNLIEGGYTAIGLGNGAALGEVWENNLTANPLFTDTINFQLPANSPSVNAGTPDITGLNLPAYDLWGNARVAFNRIDIGAYEVPDPSDINNNLINDWSLSQNYPNPFNPQTMINYTIKDGFSGLVKLKIYNAKGEVVQTITNNVAKAGHYNQVFNGSKFASGIYYYGIEAGNFKQMKKMVMVK